MLAGSVEPLSESLVILFITIFMVTIALVSIT